MLGVGVDVTRSVVHATSRRRRYSTTEPTIGLPPVSWGTVQRSSTPPTVVVATTPVGAAAGPKGMVSGAVGAAGFPPTVFQAATRNSYGVPAVSASIVSDRDDAGTVPYREFEQSRKNWSKKKKFVFSGVDFDFHSLPR